MRNRWVRRRPRPAGSPDRPRVLPSRAGRTLGIAGENNEMSPGLTKFGAFELDTGQRLLRRDGAEIHLTPKAFDLLVLLIEHAPLVVAKEALHRAMWPTTFVSDATLVGLIKELRRALDDHDREAPIIRTVQRVGYAFCQPLDTSAPNC